MSMYYPSDPCKNECNLMKQARHVRQTREVFGSMDPLRQALVRASARQCGQDYAHCSTAIVRDVVRMDCPGSMAHAEISEGALYCSSMLHRFGIPYDYAKLEEYTLPESRPRCSAPLRDPNSASRQTGAHGHLAMPRKEMQRGRSQTLGPRRLQASS